MDCFRFFRFVSLLALVSAGSLYVFGQDSLKVATNDTAAILNVLMYSGQDTLLQVLGKRSTDSTWVPVNADWNYIAATGGKAVTGQSSWRFAPEDTGFGILVVSFEGYVSDTLYVEVWPSDAPKSIDIYNSELPPGPGSIALPDPSQAIPITAGTTYLLAAKVFDWKAGLLSEYQLSPLENDIAWNNYDLYEDEYHALDNLRGAVCHFTPTRAYDTVTVVCMLRPGPGYVLIDKVSFVVLPAAGPQRFSIEPKVSLALNLSSKIDTLFIQPNEQNRSVYSTVRDRFGNFIRYGTVSQWGSLDTTIVTVQRGDASFGEGIITRNPLAMHSIARIYAVDSTGTTSDTLAIKLLFPVNLRQKETFDRHGRWSISTSNGAAFISTPVCGTHCIKIFSLSGSIIYSSRTCLNEERINLPKGVFILSAQTFGSVERFTTKVFNQ